MAIDRWENLQSSVNAHFLHVEEKKPFGCSKYAQGAPKRTAPTLPVWAQGHVTSSALVLSGVKAKEHREALPWLLLNPLAIFPFHQPLILTAHATVSGTVLIHVNCTELWLGVGCEANSCAMIMAQGPCYFLEEDRKEAVTVSILTIRQASFNTLSLMHIRDGCGYSYSKGSRSFLGSMFVHGFWTFPSNLWSIDVIPLDGENYILHGGKCESFWLIQIK